MKSLFLFLVMVCLSATTFGQVSFNVQMVSAEDVPAEVQAAQTGYFPGLSVKSWEKQTAYGPEQSGTRYVSSFTDASNQLLRSRYLQDGTGLTATTSYSGNQLPEVIKSAAAKNYSDYKLTSGEKIFLLDVEKSFYRIRLRQGGQKLIVYLNNDGEEFSRDQLPRQVLEDEKAE